MKSFAAALALSAVGAVASLGVPTLPAQSAESVRETVRLQYSKPSDVIRNLRDGFSPAAGKATSMVPRGLTKIVPNDGDSSVQLAGSAGAVGEMKTLLRLLDVRPRTVQVKARLFEVRFSEDGTRRETLLQSPILSTIHNNPAPVTVGLSEGQSTTLQVTPHINGDKSISLQVVLTARRQSPGKSGDKDAETDARAEAYLRVPENGEWQSSRLLFLDFDVRAPFYRPKSPTKFVQVGDKHLPVDRPLYRVEVTAAEVR